MLYGRRSRLDAPVRPQYGEQQLPLPGHHIQVLLPAYLAPHLKARHPGHEELGGVGDANNSGTHGFQYNQHLTMLAAQKLVKPIETVTVS
jgi:hypothetical protein